MALKTGIHAESIVISGENAQDLAALIAEYYDHWQPVSPEERLWLDALIRGEWLLRRLAVVEAHLWQRGAYDLSDYDYDDNHKRVRKLASIGEIDFSTFTFSSRIDSLSLRAGGSIARLASTWNR